MKTAAQRATLPGVKIVRAALAGLVTIAASIPMAAQLAAQDVGATSPYSASGVQSAQPLPDPAAILEEDGSTFSIPIPGGGEIQVQGPQSEPPHQMSPIENWAVRHNTPFSPGGTPIGPAQTQP